MYITPRTVGTGMTTGHTVPAHVRDQVSGRGLVTLPASTDLIDTHPAKLLNCGSPTSELR